VFVANRVGEIQRLTEIETWRHVTSSNNPTDLLSRGLSPPELADASLWWHGPAFLQSKEELWPDANFQHLGDNVPDLRKVVAAVAVVENHIVNDLLDMPHSGLLLAIHQEAPSDSSYQAHFAR